MPWAAPLTMESVTEIGVFLVTMASAPVGPTLLRETTRPYVEEPEPQLSLF